MKVELSMRAKSNIYYTHRQWKIQQTHDYDAILY